MEIVNYSFTSSYAKITVLPFTVDSLTDAVSAVLSISISSPRVPSLLRAYSFQPSIGFLNFTMMSVFFAKSGVVPWSRKIVISVSSKRILVFFMSLRCNIRFLELSLCGLLSML